MNKKEIRKLAKSYAEHYFSPRDHNRTFLRSMTDMVEAGILQATDEQQKRIAYLEAIVDIIAKRAPLADSTSDEPGITIIEAARRELRDSGHPLFVEEVQS